MCLKSEVFKKTYYGKMKNCILKIIRGVWQCERNYVKRRKDKIIKKETRFKTPLKVDRMKVAFNLERKLKRGCRENIIFRLSAAQSFTNIMDGTLKSGTIHSNQARKFALKS